jgi:predicted MFS family arabinose efflux permease
MKPAFYVLAAAVFVSGANLRLFDSLLPTVAEDFSIPSTAASIVVTAFTLAYGLFQILHGPLGDRIGRLRTVAIAALVAGIGSLGSSIAPTVSALSALRFVTGVGAAGIIPVAIAWVGDNTPYSERQATLGRFIGFSLMGQILGPAVGGAMAQWLGWRQVFFVFTAAFLAAAVALLRLDRLLRKSGDPEEDQTVRPASGVFGAYRAIVADRWVRTVLWTVGIEGLVFYGAFAYVGAWLRQEFDLSFFSIGAMMSGFGLGGVIYSLSIRWLMRRLDEPGFAFGGSLLLVTFYLGLTATPAWPIIGPLCVIGGFGFFMLHNTLQTKATEMYPKARGTAIAVFAMSLFWGQAIGVAAFGRAIAWAGYEATFVAAGLALAGLGAGFASALRRANHSLD